MLTMNGVYVKISAKQTWIVLLEVPYMKNPVSRETAEKVLNAVYDQVVNTGIQHVSKPVDEFADEYLKKEPDPAKAAKTMLNYQIAKCTVSGFVTGFGGLITLPVTIPANIASVLYVQLRMIACTAYMGGLDPKDDQVQTFVYACLAGISLNEVIKKFGVQFINKVAKVGVAKIPGKLLVKINQRLGFRFITKFGEKGLINIGKLVPVAGALINGGFDLVETKIIANRAYKMFIQHDFSVGASDAEIDAIVVEYDDVAENPEASSDN